MIRLSAFLVALAVLCSVPFFLIIVLRLQGQYDPGGVLILATIWFMFAVPILLYAAIVDGFAAIIFPRAPIAAFLLFAAVGIIGFLAFTHGAVLNQKDVMFFFWLPALTVIAIYTIANMIRSRRRRAHGNG
jgi:hypothetical protein